MMRLILAVALGGMAIGCTGIRPVGPMAKVMDANGRPVQTGASAEGDDVPAMVTIPAEPPTPPMNTIGPEDIDERNPQAAIEQLQRELAQDRLTMPTPSRTAEVSRYKGGVKQP